MIIFSFTFIILCIIRTSLAQDWQCGVPKSAHGLVYGGKTVLPGEWPWLVPLFMKKTDDFICGSNLIGHQHVLTAAHCIHDKRALRATPKEDIYAYVGRYDTTQSVNEPRSKKMDISKVYMHPKWDPQSLRYDSDIAILTFNKPVEYSNVIIPVCLPEQDFLIGTQYGNVVGFGKSELPIRHEPKPKKIQISSVTNDDCFFSNHLFAQYAAPSTFCAGERGKNPCKGDSGSGFFVNETAWTIAGLVSSAIVEDCSESEFVIFTNVAKFTNWINDQISVTVDRQKFTDVFDAFDRDPIDEIFSTNTNEVYADCQFKTIGSSYGCFVNDVVAPDNDIELLINNGQHQLRRSNRDVDVMQIVKGTMSHFPDMSKVAETFPKLSGVGITLTKMLHIQRSSLKNLKNLKFFLISDNEIEIIPPDAFADLTKLELIDLCRNEVKRMESQWISSMPNLKVFKARQNKFEFVPRGMFRNNAKLEEIYLDYNFIQVNYFDFGRLNNLHLLAMLDNKCINMIYCENPARKQCVRSLQQIISVVQNRCTQTSRKFVTSLKHTVESTTTTRPVTTTRKFTTPVSTTPMFMPQLEMMTLDEFFRNRLVFNRK